MSTIRLADRVGRIKPSPTLAVTNRAAELKAQGKDVLSLGAGEPDFDTPEHIKEAAIAALRKGFTKYTAVDGTPGLKRAIVAKFERENKLKFTVDQILVSVGGKHSYYNLAQALLQTGDEVIIPAPYWVSYPDIVLLADATPVIIEAGIEQAFKITPAQLEKAITAKTKLLVINSPSNPTGVVYTRDELAALGEVVRRHPQVWIVTDDIYEHILWSGEPFANILNVCPELGDRTVVLNGVSKAYSMTGWRIGYVGGPKTLVSAMKNIQSQSTSNPTSIAQVAAEAGLNGDQGFIGTMVRAFKERHDYIVQRLNTIRGVRCIASQGAFYAFPDMRGAIDNLGMKDDLALCEYLLDKAGVAVVPGSAFGSNGYIRISFATSMDVIKGALDRMENLLGRAEAGRAANAR